MNLYNTECQAPKSAARKYKVLKSIRHKRVSDTRAKVARVHVFANARAVHGLLQAVKKAEN